MTTINTAIIISAKDASSAVLGSIGKSLGGIADAATAPMRALGGVVDVLGRVGLAGMGLKAIAEGVAGVATGMVAGNAQMETYETQLGTLLGSTDAAKERLAELAKFGATTPFELPEVVRAEKVLLGFGLSGEKALKMTQKSAGDLRRVIGDIAAGTGAQFEEIALTFGKFSAGATGEAISRLQELGVVTREQLAEMGIQFSKSGELVSPLPEAMAAAVKIAEGKFGGGMEKLSQTFAGQMSTLADNFNQAKIAITKPIFDVLAKHIGTVNNLLSSDAFQNGLTGFASTLSDVVSFGVGKFEQIGSAVAAFVKYLSPGNDYDLMRAWFGPGFGPKIDEVVRAVKGMIETLSQAPQVLSNVGQVVQGVFEDLFSLENTDSLQIGLEKLFGEGNPIVGQAMDMVFAINDALKSGWNAILTEAENIMGELSLLLFGADVRESASSTWEMVTQTAEYGLEAIRKAVETVTGIINGLWGQHGDTIVSTGLKFWDLTHVGIADRLRIIREVVSAAIAGIQQGWAEHGERITANAKQIWSAIETAIQAVLNEVVPFIMEQFGTVIGWVQENWPLIQQTISTVMAAVVAVIDTTLGAIITFWNAHGDSIMKIVGFVWNTVKTVVETAIKAVLGTLKAVMLIITGDWDGAWQAIKGVVETVWEGIKTVVGNALGALWAMLELGWGLIRGTAQIAWDAIAGVITGAVDGAILALRRALASAINSIIDSINNFIDQAQGVINLINMFHGEETKWFLPKLGHIQAFAAGGIVTRPTLALLGERGPEAVVPLTGPSRAASTIVVNVNVAGSVWTTGDLVDEVYTGLLQKGLSNATLGLP